MVTQVYTFAQGRIHRLLPDFDECHMPMKKSTRSTPGGQHRAGPKSPDEQAAALSLRPLSVIQSIVRSQSLWGPATFRSLEN